MREGSLAHHPPRARGASADPPRLWPRVLLTWLILASIILPSGRAESHEPADAELYLNGRTAAGFGGGELTRWIPEKGEPEKVQPSWSPTNSTAAWTAVHAVNFTLHGPVQVKVWVENLDDVVHTGDPADPAAIGRPHFAFVLRLEGEPVGRGTLTLDTLPAGDPTLLEASIVIPSETAARADGSLRLEVTHEGRGVDPTDPTSPLRYLVNSTGYPSSILVPDVPAGAFRERFVTYPQDVKPASGAPSESTPPVVTAPGNESGAPPERPSGFEKAAVIVALAAVASLSGWAASRVFRGGRP